MKKTKGQIGTGSKSMVGFSLETWQTIFVWTVWITAVAGGISITAALVSALAADKASDLVREEADKRISDAKEQGEKAMVTAAQANQGAEKAKLDTEKIRQNNIFLQTQLEAERIDRLKLEAQIAPRTLTIEQRYDITVALTSFSGKKFSGKNVRVLTYALDAESAIIGQQIINCLDSANIKAENGIASISPVNGFANGIHVDGPDEPLVHAIIESLSKTGHLAISRDSRAFNSTGMASGIGAEPLSSFSASILIGVKPIKGK